MKKILLGILLLFISFGGYGQRAAEFKNGITIQKEEVLASKFVSYGESYINNWRDLVLDDGATYFPNNGGYEKGRLHQLGIIPSLHFIPAAVGEGVIYAIGKNRTNDLTVARASLATYIDEDRILRTAAIDFARIDYTDGDGTFLFEYQSTNLILWSEDYSNVSWTKSGITLNFGYLSPDGTMNATKVTGVIGSSYIKTGNVASGAEPRKSIWARTVSGTGIISLGTNTAPFTITEEWKRFDTFNSNLDIYAADFRHANTTLTEVILWGAQIEDQSTLTSYIKTEATTVTRLADVITGAGDVNTFNSVSGSFKVNIRTLSNDLSVRTISINDGTANNAITIGYNTVSNTILAEYIISGTPMASLSYQVSDITEYHDVEFQYALNDFKLLIDDVQRDTDVSGAVLSADTLDSLDYHDGAGSNSFFGKQKQLIIQK